MENGGNRIGHFTIVGGGSAGWMTAGLLLALLNRRSDGPDVRVSVIESPTVPIIGVGEATTLSTWESLGQLSIDENAFIQSCEASFKCAVRFSGWNLDDAGKPIEFYHPFQSPTPIWGASPALHYHRRQRRGVPQPSFAHSMSVMPALLDANRAPRTMGMPYYEGLFSYSYHLDATLLGAHLKEYCLALGAEYISDDVVDVTLDDRGFVGALQLRERGAYPVEFVIDCSGFRGLILRRALDEPFIPYDGHLLCDRALAAQIPHRPGAVLPPYTTSTALPAGWAWNVPLHSRRGTGYVFSSRFRGDDEAIDEFLAHLGEDGKGAEPRVIPLHIGRARRSWVKNCLAVGLSSGFIEPLESTSIHLIQIAVRRFTDFMPDRGCDPLLADAYNASIASMYEDIRDFIAMHYATSNLDHPFWQAARAPDVVPERVRNRLALWKRKLPSPLDLDIQNPLFPAWSYLYVLFGKRFFDDCDFPLESTVSDADFDEFLADTAKRRNQLLERAPDHRALLDRVHAAKVTPWYDTTPSAMPAQRAGTPG